MDDKEDYGGVGRNGLGQGEDRRLAEVELEEEEDRYFIVYIRMARRGRVR